MSILEVNAIRPRTGTSIDLAGSITIGSGKTITGTTSQFKITGGTTGQAIITDGAGNISFGDVDALPSQTGQTGKFLTTDGTDPSWDTVAQFSLPTQTGNAGKYLTTDGTNESWGTVSGAEIQELNNFFKNWNVIDTTITTTVPSTENAAIIGPLGINSTGAWSIDGLVTIM